MTYPPQGTGATDTKSNTTVNETTYGQAPTAGIATTDSRGDHTHGTPGYPALSNLTDVVLTSAVTDQILKYNGADWVNGASVAASAGPGVIFYLDSTKTIPAGVGPQTKSMETLLKTPSVAVEVDEDATVNNNTLIIDQYMYNTPLGVATIDAGEWVFDTYTYASSISGTSEVICSIGRVIDSAGIATVTGSGLVRTVTVTGGTPFVAGDYDADLTLTSRVMTSNAVLVITGYTSTSEVTTESLMTYTNESGVTCSVDRYLFQSTTGDIENTTVGLKESIVVEPAFAVNTTDRLTAHYFAKTDNSGDITLHLVHNGTQNYTHFHTPLATKHNDLAGLQGGTTNEYYHLTNAEYTALPSMSATVVTETSYGQASTAGISTLTFSLGDHTHGTPVVPALGDLSDVTLTAPAPNEILEYDGAVWVNNPVPPSLLLSDALRNTKGGTDALLTNTSGTDNSAFGYNALKLDTASFNTAFGSYALDANTSGINNTAIGYHALGANISGSNNTMIGYQAGLVNTVSDNTFVGSNAGDANTTGTGNVAVGRNALGANITSNDCTMVGYQAGLVNTAANNTFIGSDAGDANTTGANNVAIGRNALGNIINTDNNVAIGQAAGSLFKGNASVFIGNNAGGQTVAVDNIVCIGADSGVLNTASNNTFVGAYCADANTSGSENTALGQDAFGANTTGSYNTTVGKGALGANISGSNNTMIGYQAGLVNMVSDNTFIGSNAGDANITGTGNVAVGKDALGANDWGWANTMIGYQAGAVNTAGENTFIGCNAGDANTTGSYNTAVGKDALGASVWSWDNTMVGYQTGKVNEASNNTFIGSQCGDSNTTGGNNTALGKDALGANISGSDNVMIGYQAGLVNEADNNTFVGSGAGDANITGASNTAVGKGALGANDWGWGNTMIGYEAGLLCIGGNNTFIGSGCDGSAAAITGAIGIGYNVSVTADNTWVIGTIGKKQAIVEGSNAAMGTAILTSGTGSIVVANTLVTVNSRIFLTSQDPNGGTQGAVFVSARNSGTDFTIMSTIGALDTSIVAWELKESN